MSGLSGTASTKVQPIDSVTVKSHALALGSDLCGIASVEAFSGAPPGHHPRDVMSDGRSVVVLALSSLEGPLSSDSMIAYTMMRNRRLQSLDSIPMLLSLILEEHGYLAVPIPSAEPYDFDRRERKICGVISLKHAASLAGLGRIGRSTLLINHNFGNMLWLGALITTAALAPDPLVTHEVCPASCSVCMDSCPAHALDGASINRRRCGRRAFSSNKYTGRRITCCACRSMCPNSRRIQKSTSIAAECNVPADDPEPESPDPMDPPPRHPAW